LTEKFPEGGGATKKQDRKIAPFGLGLGPHLFVKVPRPGDSEVTFSVFECLTTHR